MATPTDSAISMDVDKNMDRKQSAPAAGADVRRSMLQLARKSLMEAPRASKMSKHASKISVRPEPQKNEDAKSEGDGEDTVVSSEGTEFGDVVLSPQDEQRKSLQEEVEEAKFNPFYRLHLIGFFKGLLDRLSVLMQLPDASSFADSHIDLEKIPEEQKNLQHKKKLLASANLINYTLPHPIRISKFETEAKWLQDVLEKAAHEMETKCTFEILNKVVEADIAREKRLPEAIESVKDLKWKTEVNRHIMKMEAAAHLESKREWAQNLNKHKRREKLVHKAVMDYMGKQNMLLREEVVNLTDNLDNDNQCMDWAIERIETQIKMKNMQINDIQPQYDAEMEANAKAEAKEKKRLDDWYANLGYSELSLKSAYKIQKIWRGYLIRRVWGKVLKKLRKKRLAAKKKGKKK
ncbi:hypothetical protein KC19_6G196900 [Ceratodon purpureus]|uniref:Dynein regulatory complex protein 9 n=1 Tax=Ceratodon purpureus TaxID=3225 RepID=A0A8T0HJF1_CERPU|nr:hypothetical protein KC19_6G196900 [Ceratodon purpureus]